jgi:pullulanase
MAAITIKPYQRSGGTMNTLHPVRSSLRAIVIAAFCFFLFACVNGDDAETQAKAELDQANKTLSVLAAANPPSSSADVCNIADASTIITPIPTSTAGVTPGNVRVHYNRPDAAYGDWGLHLWQINDAGQYIADYPGVSWPSPLVRSGIDGYGAYFDIEATKFTNAAAAGFGFIVHPPGQAGDPNVDRSWKFSDGNEIWLRSGDTNVYRSNPIANTPNIDTVRVHYKRFDRNFNDWGLHLWPTNGLDISRLAGLTIDQYQNPVPFSAMPNYQISSNAYDITFDIPVVNPSSNANRTALEFIIHGMPSNLNGGVNNKDGWSDNIRVSYSSLSISDGIGHVWLVQEEPRVFTTIPDTRSVSSTDARAIWLTKNSLQWPKTDSSGVFKLYYSNTGQLVVKRGAPVSGADGALLLSPAAAVPSDIAQRFKYVAAGTVLSINASDDAQLAAALKQQLLVVQEDADGNVLGATTTQLAGQLDDRYRTADAIDDLGVSASRGKTQFKLWAPTAQNVTLCTYGARGPATSQNAMRYDADTGIWAFNLDGNRSGQYYRYAVDVFVRNVGIVRNIVTDPYSLSLNANSQRSYIADLDSPLLAPPLWKFYRGPAVPAQEDMSIYELHVRDFSLNDKTVRPAFRGKYLGFTEWQSDGMRHLRQLSRAGLTDVHLLPVFDIANIPEVDCKTPIISPLAAADSEEQQAAVNAVRDADCFNWGYDPWHYTAPEGSYASDADNGAARIRELRSMVMALNFSGLRVGMDVVYNHTSASGQNAQSVLDRIVPGYYHRLNAMGDIERSTCCENTATENLMMGKLMIDSVKIWATQYRIDSFRFDLMGHQPRAVMEKLRDEVSAAAGRPIQLIGEGWNFGEVANGARFVQATQLSLNGSGIGTFSDRAREQVRGGGGFDSGVNLLRNQGYINGLYYDDNGSGGNKSKNDLMWAADIIKVGLAGSIRSYELNTHWDAKLPLEQINYNGQPAGYVTDPQEVVNYVENHDNQTLFDNNVYKLPLNTSREDRARVQMLGAAINTFSQGVAYYHAGIDTLRSKSMDRNSYNSGDWFNAIDWSYRSNNYGVGVPLQGDNGENWSIIKPLLANADIKPSSNDIRWTRDAFRDLLRIRDSSRLFRMRTADEIKQRLTFYNTGSTQEPTVLAAHLDGRNYHDAGFKELIYFVNVDKTPHTLTLAAEKAKRYRLHPVHTQYDAADKRPATARYHQETGTFSIPPRTAVVFTIR